MDNHYDPFSRDSNSTALDYKNVTASDTIRFQLCRAIRFDVGGTVKLVKNDDTTATFIAVAGKDEPFSCKGVMVTGSDAGVVAGGILAIYR